MRDGAMPLGQWLTWVSVLIILFAESQRAYSHSPLPTMLRSASNETPTDFDDPSMGELDELLSVTTELSLSVELPSSESHETSGLSPKAEPHRLSKQVAGYWTPSKIQTELALSKKGFKFLNIPQFVDLPNVHLAYRHDKDQIGESFASAVLANLQSYGSWRSLPQQIQERQSFSSESPIVIALHLLDRENFYPEAHETLSRQMINSPVGFRNQIHTSKQSPKYTIHVQEYFVPLRDFKNWQALTPSQVASMIFINNSLGSGGSIHASVFQGFGASTAFPESYLGINAQDFLTGTKNLLTALRDSDNFSERHTTHPFCPSPADYFILGSDLRPTIHQVGGHTLAFLSYDMDQELYMQWLVLTHLFNQSSKPLEVEDCGWPLAITEDFKNTIKSWWAQMTEIKGDQKRFLKARFVCTN